MAAENVKLECQVEVASFFSSFADGDCEIDIIDSKRDEETGNLIYKLRSSKYAWAKEEDLTDYAHMVSAFWRKNEDDSPDITVIPAPPHIKRGRKRKASNPKKLEEDGDVCISILKVVEAEDFEQIVQILEESETENDDEDDIDYVPNGDDSATNEKDKTSASRKRYPVRRKSSVSHAKVPKTSGVVNSKLYPAEAKYVITGDNLEITDVIKCSACGDKFTMLDKYRTHWNEKHNDKTYSLTCSFCDKVFRKPSDLMSHALAHTDAKPHQCMYCESTFRRRYTLNHHINTVHGEGVFFTCHICRMQMKTKEELESHYSENHGGSKFICRKCKILFETRSELDTHAKLCKEHFKCSQCPKTFVSNSDCRMHERMHDGTNPHYCELCNRYFLKRSKLLAHMKRHDSTLDPVEAKKVKEEQLEAKKLKVLNEPRPEFICAYCEKKFIDKRCYINHVKIHEGTCPFHCESCNHYFSSKTKLNMHAKTVHSEDAPYICEICNRRFKLEKYLLSHMRSHGTVAKEKTPVDPSKRYGCKTCNASFERVTEFKKHLQYSSTCISLECSICNQRFQDNKKLNVHLKIHTDVKDFPCSTCSQQFRHRYDLVKHERKHLIDQQFPCDKCEERFIEKWQLRAHTEWHETGKHPFQCEICDKILSKHSKLQAHIRQVHNRERDHVCETCGKEYTSKSDLKKHERIHDLEYEHGEYTCMVCHANGFTKESLEEHQLVHLRVQTNKSSLLDFDQLNQINQNYLEDSNESYNEEGYEEEQEGEEELSDTDINFTKPNTAVEIPSLLNSSNLNASEIVESMEVVQVIEDQNQTVESTQESDEIPVVIETILQASEVDTTNQSDSEIPSTVMETIMQAVNSSLALAVSMSVNSTTHIPAVVTSQYTHIETHTPDPINSQYTSIEDIQTQASETVDSAYANIDNIEVPRMFRTVEATPNITNQSYVPQDYAGSATIQVISSSTSQPSHFHSVDQLLMAAKESKEDNHEVTGSTYTQ